MWRFTVPAVEVSVPRMRRAVRDLLNRQKAPVSDDILQGLLLIVSELVTNVVCHAALLSPELGVEITLAAGWVRVAVEDGHPYRPKPLELDHGQTGGRGLLLVRETALEAGGTCDVERTASGGKIVWALLPLSQGAGAVPGRSGTGRPEGEGAAGPATSPRSSPSAP